MPRSNMHDESTSKSSILPACIGNQKSNAMSKIHDDHFKDLIHYLETRADYIRESRTSFYKQLMLSLPASVCKKKIKDFIDNPPSTFSSGTTIKSMTTLRRRSGSLPDEGYMTTESSNGSNTGTTTRQSRSRMKSAATKRLSRSLSNTIKKTNINSHKTPANKYPLNSYGLVTPKVKPNTPQVLLRRPKEGEMALSLQGSPLYTGSASIEPIPNVNIPLADGRLLTIQPKYGLRVSQIPFLDEDTKRHLETLKDNLNKVCSIVNNTEKK